VKDLCFMSLLHDVPKFRIESIDITPRFFVHSSRLRKNDAIASPRVQRLASLFQMIHSIERHLTALKIVTTAPFLVLLPVQLPI
jgi:hypothetical protein